MDTSFYAIDENGNHFVCEAIAEATSPHTSRDILIYTDGKSDETGALRAYASYITKEVSKLDDSGRFAAIKLEPIMDDREWAFLEELLVTLREEA